MEIISFQNFAMPGALLVLITTMLLLTVRDWRVSLVLLAVQYIGVFVLVAIHWPMMIALTKLVAGWIAAAVLTTAMYSAYHVAQETDPTQNIHSFFRMITGLSISAWVFRMLTAAMIVLVVFTLAPLTAQWIPTIQFEEVIGALILLCLGLLHLGLTAYPLRVVIALLTTLSGFEIIYAAVEVSTLVAGLLAVVTMGLALIGAYFQVTSSREVEI